MSNYIKIVFLEIFQEQKDALIALLSDMDFDGFEEGHNFLIAYCKKDNFKEEELVAVAQTLSVRFEKELLEEKNWNEEWEKNFHPVLVEDFCNIRAHFHKQVSGVEYDLVITPKMSFGTGHHATTYMMIQWMKKIDHSEKRVLDFGTGTGVLAILAEKMGAKKIVAIDNDDWSIENAAENILHNNCFRIQLQKADSVSFTDKFDIILANINRSVLLSSMGLLQQHLEDSGVLLISGLLEGDQGAIETAANEKKLIITGQISKEGWISLQLMHN